MTVDLIGLDQVGEHEPLLELPGQDSDGIECLLVARPGQRARQTAPGEQVLDLPDPDHARARRNELLQVALARRRQREVAAALGALEVARLAGEGPGDHAPDRVRPRHHFARPPAGLVQPDDVSFRYYVWQLGYGLFPWSGFGAAGLLWWLRFGSKRDDAESEVMAFMALSVHGGVRDVHHHAHQVRITTRCLVYRPLPS